MLDDCGETSFAVEPKARVEDGLRGAEGSMGGAGRSIQSRLSGDDGQAEDSVLMQKEKYRETYGRFDESDVERSGVCHS